MRHLVAGHTATLRYRSQAFEDVVAHLRRETIAPGGTLVTLYGGPRQALHDVAADLAAGLGRDLYRVDLAGVVSKWIGETEKNLGLLFSRAESRNWILFFDEADALFGKRSDVKDSHDRYANQEVSYLLGLLESFRGIAILATNTPPVEPPRRTGQRLRHVRVKFPPD